MDSTQTALLLQRTRLLTVFASLFLSVQLFGNLYEEIVSNTRMMLSPQPGTLVGEFSAGSPVYYYLPWAPLGVILTFVLFFRLATAPSWVRRRMRWALAFLPIAVLTKAYLITKINPLFRDPSQAPEILGALAIKWAILNGVAILAIAATLWAILSWRGDLLDKSMLNAN